MHTWCGLLGCFGEVWRSLKFPLSERCERFPVQNTQAVPITICVQTIRWYWVFVNRTLGSSGWETALRIKNELRRCCQSSVTRKWISGNKRAMTKMVWLRIGKIIHPFHQSGHSSQFPLSTRAFIVYVPTTEMWTCALKRDDDQQMKMMHPKNKAHTQGTSNYQCLRTIRSC